MNTQAWLDFSITDGSEGWYDYSCLRTIGHGFSIPRVTDRDNPRGEQGGDGVVILTTPMQIFNNGSSSVSRDSSVALQLAFLL
jgi:hypothetical protein